jgi:UDP-glucose 4-epimerase
MKFLITGGAGYIGSTIASALLDAGHTPVILDNLSVGKREFVRGRIFYEGDIADEALLERIFAEHPDIQATVHCAALIIVPESVVIQRCCSVPRPLFTMMCRVSWSPKLHLLNRAARMRVPST